MGLFAFRIRQKHCVVIYLSDMNKATWSCPYCQYEVPATIRGVAISNHLVKKHKISKLLAHIEYVKIQYSLSASDIRNMVKAYSKGKSYPILREETGLPLSTIHKIIKAKGVGRTIVEAAQGANVVRENTCIRRYGRNNVSKLKETKDKKEQTFLDHYGVSNIFKTEEFKINLDKHMIEKYGVKRIIGPMTHAFQPKTEDQVEKILQELEVPYKRSFYLEGRQYDFLLPEVKLIIEVNGDFWHANPAKYKAEDRLSHPGGNCNILAREIWAKDLTKKLLAENCGYRIITIWELDLKTKSKEELTAEISNKYREYKAGTS